MGLVKIGFAENARKRFSKIQSDSPTRLVLAGIEDGGESLEAARHAQFAGYRQRGEWFQFDGALRDFVEALPSMPAKEASLNARIAALGVSKTHASQIVNGKGHPCLSLAVAIWRATGWKCHRIANAADADLEAIERVDPWTPPKDREAA
jgi:hypothetical protein